MKSSQESTSNGHADLGSQLGIAIRANAKGKALENITDLEEGSIQLLDALHVAYSDTAFQAEIKELYKVAAGDELKFITSLAPVAGRVQAPVFTKFGLPAGQRGVMLMKMGVKLVAKRCPQLKVKSGDLRELLCLPREEETAPSLDSTVEAGLSDLVAKIERAPLDVRGPLAEALQLPRDASARQIAIEVPKIKERAKEIAAKHMAKGRSNIVGHGKVLGPDMCDASDEELQAKLYESFEHYLTKMLARVITPVTSFTKPPSEFQCSWANGVVQEHNVRELWSSHYVTRSPKLSADWLSHGAGLTVIDNAIERELILPALKELNDLRISGALDPSKDPCNIGAKSQWLHLSTEEERQRWQQATPALFKLCLLMFGLPFALDATAKRCVQDDLDVPNLLVHPHVMAATYAKGAEYHCHKDSYGGQDNQRMLTILLYLNDDWIPGDGGELRIFNKLENGDGAKAPDTNCFVDIEPLCGRLVFFRSRDVWHAVREPEKVRWAMTLWVMAE